MAIGVRIEPELEQQLDQLAQRLGRSRSACVREAIAQYVQQNYENGSPRIDASHMTDYARDAQAMRLLTEILK